MIDGLIPDSGVGSFFCPGLKPGRGSFRKWGDRLYLKNEAANIGERT
jgi:hypothetical protein